jgi:C4-dicarboxylate-specific signal transduction histidine kinase
LVKGEAALQPVDLNQVVSSTLNLAKSELLARQTRIDFRRSPAPANVLGNFAQLQQIVLNLIVNAVEATSQQPPSARSIEISVGMKDPRTCELSVTDNGPGLSPEMKANAFKPFVSTKSNGLGLGLAICRSIALAHGGNLQFDAGRMKGAEIALTLPVQAAAA